MEHAAAQRERVGEMLAKLDVEQDDLRREAETVEHERATAAESRARDARVARAVHARSGRPRDRAGGGARRARAARARDVRTREQELAGIEARLASLEELAASRREFSDAARMVLVQANGRVGQQGAVADYLDVDGRYERAVEAVPR